MELTSPSTHRVTDLLADLRAGRDEAAEPPGVYSSTVSRD